MKTRIYFLLFATVFITINGFSQESEGEGTDSGALDQFSGDDRSSYNKNSGVEENLYNLGLKHYYGEGTKADKKKAFEFFEKSAKRSYAPAQYNLGMMYYKGEGTEMNKDQAFYWCHSAAKKEIIPAQTALVNMYSNGEGTEIDKKQAEFWASKAEKNRKKQQK